MIDERKFNSIQLYLSYLALEIKGRIFDALYTCADTR